MSDGAQITEEELTNKWGQVNHMCLEWMEDKELLNDWLPLMEEVVGILEEAYHKSFQLFESGHFKREPILGKLRDLLSCAMSEV
jgi:hypothetical protein